MSTAAASVPFKVAILIASSTCATKPEQDKIMPILSSLLLANNCDDYRIVRSDIVPDHVRSIRSTVLSYCEDLEGVDLVLTSGGTGFSSDDVTTEAISPLIDKWATGLVHRMLSHSLEITPYAALSNPIAGVHYSSSSAAASPSTTSTSLASTSAETTASSATNRRATLIIALPGSPKGASENLEAVLPVLKHALQLMRGRGGNRGGESSRVLHEKMNAAGGNSDGGGEDHHHHHAASLSGGCGGCGGHRVPKARTSHPASDPTTSSPAASHHSISTRHRHSPHPLVPISTALDLILSNTYPTEIETVSVNQDLVGFVLAEEVRASEDLPRGERGTTNVDGYALLASSTPIGIYNLHSLPSSTSALHRTPAASPIVVKEGTIYRINTGAPLPLGTDSVIMVEDTEVVERWDSTTAYLREGEVQGERGEERTIRLLAQVDAGENVRRKGSDTKEGDLLLEKGEVVGSGGGEIGGLIFLGKKEVKVHGRPTVAVFSTGNELIDLTSPSTTSPSTTSSVAPSPFNGIPDSNRPSLLSILQAQHYNTIDLGIIPDSLPLLIATLNDARSRADVVICTGGTSMGVGDLIEKAATSELGAEGDAGVGGKVIFGRVAMKPGKPTTVVMLPPPSSSSSSSSNPSSHNPHPRLLFALPGNPASALVTFWLFVMPCLRKMEGREKGSWQLPRVGVELTSDIQLDSRPEFHRVQIRPSPPSSVQSGASHAATATSTSTLKAYSTGIQRSSRTVSLVGANGLLVLPARAEANQGEGITSLRKGDVVMCVMIGEIGAPPS